MRAEPKPERRAKDEARGYSGNHHCIDFCEKLTCFSVLPESFVTATLKQGYEIT